MRNGKGNGSEMLPEVVNWKSGGVMKSVATVGVVKGDVNGHLVGKHSHNSVTTPLEFLIVVPGGFAITEYQLLHLHENGNNREFSDRHRRRVSCIWRRHSVACLQYDGKKVGKRQYCRLAGIQTGEGRSTVIAAGCAQSERRCFGQVVSFQLSSSCRAPHSFALSE